jgi:hypothetical protein
MPVYIELQLAYPCCQLQRDNAADTLFNLAGTL